MKEKINDSLRSFVILFVGQTISQFGSSMTGFATIIWAYTEKGEVMASSILAVCSIVPYLVVSLIGGTIVDNSDKKKIMLICDSAAALGSFIIFICYSTNCLQLWILCLANIFSGFMNAFQGPASQVAITLLVNKKDYARIGGIQSVVGSIVGMITPVLAATILSFGGLGLILIIDLCTFFIAFLTLAFLVHIPNTVSSAQKNNFINIKKGMKEGISYIRKQKSILLMLIMFSTLEFAGSLSFDSMYTPLLLARTGDNEMAVGAVSTCIAAGCMASSLMLSLLNQPKNKLPVMFTGCAICLSGITLFGLGRNIYWWCIVAFVGCFGAPIYQTYQNVILREYVPIQMQGRIFSIQGMITQILTPVGYILGALMADYILEPFVSKNGSLQNTLSLLTGGGKGSGISLIFVFAGTFGLIVLSILSRNRNIRKLDE